VKTGTPLSAIVWFRQDLRLDDNPAFEAALAHGTSVIPVFIWDPEGEGEWAPGGASRVWLHGSLRKLDSSLRKKRSRLVLRRGKSLNVLQQLLKETKANAVFWNRRYEPAVVAHDRQVAEAFASQDVKIETFNSLLLFEPWTVQNKSSKPYKIFTPFYRACRALPEPERPIDAPAKIASPKSWPSSLKLDSLRLLPRIPWDKGIRQAWQHEENRGGVRIEDFVHYALADYPDSRDRPDIEGTSRISPNLHWGELSPRRAWHAVRATIAHHKRTATGKAGEAFLRQLIWREFAYHLLYHFPQIVSVPLHPNFAKFRWRRDRRALKAWHKGQTGYPIVDAGMRQLWTTGWMHNRVRMLVGSFLVKDLLLPWQLGAKWFWDTLVDADLANNSLGWQWVAGCGVDAAPFFRVFNPVLQGQKFDPHGDYVRQWAPELASLPDRWIHKPWEAPAAVLREAGVELGHSYPRPLVDHNEARDRALAVFRKTRENGG
jgi:deoxyribodipyrimidine photo-lyase